MIHHLHTPPARVGLRLQRRAARLMDWALVTWLRVRLHQLLCATDAAALDTSPGATGRLATLMTRCAVLRLRIRALEQATGARR